MTAVPCPSPDAGRRTGGDAGPHSIADVSDDLSLFGDEPRAKPGQPGRAELPIADWLVAEIRAALTAQGHTTMAGRQEVVESAVGRPVESLRSLTRAEALRILTLLRSTPAPSAGRASSAWDDREEDTWIDRL